MSRLEELIAKRDELIASRPRFDYEYERGMAAKYNYLRNKPCWGLEYRKTPVDVGQLSLFPILHDLFLNEFPTIIRRGKGKGTQIKWLANKFNVPITAAKKAYETAMIKARYQALYENYINNKEYFDWMETPDYHEHAAAVVKAFDDVLAERNRIFDEKVASGEEHVVRIEELDNALNSILDRNIEAYNRSQQPASFLAKHMTRHDFEILNNRGLIEVWIGDPGTLANHPFLDHLEPEEVKPAKTNIFKCSCGETLDINIVGLNKKLGAFEKVDFKCLSCLGMTEKEAQDMIDYYKGGGCTLFI